MTVRGTFLNFGHSDDRFLLRRTNGSWMRVQHTFDGDHAVTADQLITRSDGKKKTAMGIFFSRGSPHVPVK